MRDLFSNLGSILVWFDSVAILFWIILLCIFIPLILVQFRSIASMVGDKGSVDLQSFHVKGSSAHTRDAVRAFARKFGYTIAHTDSLRGLLVLHDKPSEFMSPGMYYSVFVNQSDSDHTLVSVGFHNPLDDWIFSARSLDLAGTEWFMHVLAQELVSSKNPLVAHPERPPAESRLFGTSQGKYPPSKIWLWRAVCAFYIVGSAAVFIETLWPPVYETAKITGKRIWSDPNGSQGNYILLMSSNYWSEYYVQPYLYGQVRVGDTLALSALPWSLDWKSVTVLRTGEVISPPLGQRINEALIRIVGLILAAAFLYFSPRLVKNSTEE